MYSNILGPYGRSQSAKRAMDIAIKISKASNANVIIYNVIEEIAIPPTLDTIKFKSNTTGEDITK